MSALAAGPITASELSEKLKAWESITQAVFNELFYPFGRDVYIKSLETRFGLFPSGSENV